jgi:hypothetical protein
MRSVIALLSAATFAAAGTAYAVSPPPAQMSEAELDQTTAGALINVFAVDVVDVNNNTVKVAIPVNAAVAAEILTSGSTANAFAAQPGRIKQ